MFPVTIKVGQQTRLMQIQVGQGVYTGVGDRKNKVTVVVPHHAQASVIRELGIRGSTPKDEATQMNRFFGTLLARAVAATERIRPVLDGVCQQAARLNADIDHPEDETAPEVLESVCYVRRVYQRGPVQPAHIHFSLQADVTGSGAESNLPFPMPLA